LGVSNEENMQYLIKSFLDVVVLSMLSKSPRHGYKIIADIHSQFGVLMSPGTVYPLLNSLENEKLIEVVKNKRKKVYRLAPLGRDRITQLKKTCKINIEKIFDFFDERTLEI